MAYKFVQAKYYTPTSGRAIDLVIIHTMEYPERLTAAEDCAAFFASPSSPRASAHYCVDSNSVVQGVLDKDIAYHAPGANNNGIGIEHAGYASQGAADWSDAYSDALLRQSAKLTAELCKKYNIPVVFLKPGDLLAGKRGISTHRYVSEAWKRSDHWDPGYNFPEDKYIRYVKEVLGGVTVPDIITPAPHRKDIKRGDSGPDVKELQGYLKKFGANIVVDGEFGPATEAAVKAFQEFWKVKVIRKGVVGPVTWAAIYRVNHLIEFNKKNELRLGSSGPAVRELQGYLKKFGANITVDGKFGPATEAAVKTFQNFWKVKVIRNGVVGPVTWAAIYKVNHLIEFNKKKG